MNKIVFFKIGWMEHYKGISKSDKISSGAKYINENKFGHEIFNFYEYNGNVYGYVQVKGKIALENLGVSKSDNKIENVTVIWTAARKNGGVYIIGWYSNATIYREVQEDRNLLYRKYKRSVFGYNLIAKSNDVKLLAVDERTFEIPKNKMNRSFIQYAKENNNFLENIKLYIKGKKINTNKKSKSKSKKVNIEKRLKVEKIAIDIVKEYYENINYTVKSVEKENVGWDLEAIIDKTKLKLEVKGLSGKELQFELTPNEYEKSKKYIKDYRLCIVTNSLKTPVLKVFYYSYEDKKWTDGKIKLKIEEKIAAKFKEKICNGT